MAQIGTAYTIAKGVLPILGVTKMYQVEEAVKIADIVLSEAEVSALEADQACVDIVYDSDEGSSLVNRIESRNGLLTLEHAEEIGLGNRSYEIVSVD